MYKRDTFGHLALHSGVVPGEILKEIDCRFYNCEKECVMRKQKEIRSKWVTIRFNETERNKLEKLYKKTTCNNVGEYSRSVLLNEPVTVFFRNQSADDFLEEILLLRKELNTIGNNFNQLVHKLHILDSIPEIKAWAILNESGKKSFIKKVAEIGEKMSAIYEKLEQESPAKSGLPM